MSGAEERDVSRLARELADTAGAVPVLVGLLQCGGSASRETLLAAGNYPHVDDAIRWLTAVDLVRRTGGSGTFDLDQHGISYELTAIGASLTRSLIDLSKAFTEPATGDRRKASIAED
ncbi:hypothetical protein [Dactylosporangium sp. CA-092794]|uniref:hypothetical protein n=1 Tax=Dactylosporangium sp. CA-092794 TaxID=3239929 RepID=UPI003D8AC61F